MIVPETCLVTLVTWVGRISVPSLPTTPGRGRPLTPPHRQFWQALVGLMLRPLHAVHARLGAWACCKRKVIARIYDGEPRASAMAHDRRADPIGSPAPVVGGCSHGRTPLWRDHWSASARAETSLWP